MSTADIFDAVVRLDEQFVGEGAAEGLARGEQLGMDEGREVG